MTGWHGDPALKAEVFARMVAHRAEDSVLQGSYQQLDPALGTGYRGCLIGCTLPQQPPRETSYRTNEVMRPAFGWHAEVDRLYGIPHRVAQCMDNAFEGLAEKECAAFAVESIAAVPVGANLDRAADRWLLAILTDPDTLDLAVHDLGEDARVLAEVVTFMQGRVDALAQDDGALGAIEARVRPIYKFDLTWGSILESAVEGHPQTAVDLGAAVGAVLGIEAAQRWWRRAAEKLLDILRTSPVG